MRANRQHGDQHTGHPQLVRLQSICGYLAVGHVLIPAGGASLILNLILCVFWVHGGLKSATMISF